MSRSVHSDCHYHQEAARLFVTSPSLPPSVISFCVSCVCSFSLRLLLVRRPPSRCFLLHLVFVSLSLSLSPFCFEALRFSRPSFTHCLSFVFVARAIPPDLWEFLRAAAGDNDSGEGGRAMRDRVPTSSARDCIWDSRYTHWKIRPRHWNRPRERDLSLLRGGRIMQRNSLFLSQSFPPLLPVTRTLIHTRTK